MDTEVVSVKEPRSDDSVTDRLRFLMALCVVTLGAVALLLVAKVFATGASVASGVPGGIFTPMLLIGAALGSLWAQLVGLLPTLTSPSAGSYALVGMAAATAASIHAPLTAAVLVFELSGDSRRFPEQA